MGEKRRAVIRLACETCGQSGYDPCLNRISGKTMKNFHRSRRREGSHEVLNKQVAKLDGAGDLEEFMMFCYTLLGLKEHNYPVKIEPSAWQALYDAHPGIDPKDQYHGSF